MAKPKEPQMDPMRMMDQTVRDLYHRRNELNTALNRLVYEFEKQTGMRVTHVKFSPYEQLTSSGGVTLSSEPYFRVSVEI